MRGRGVGLRSGHRVPRLLLFSFSGLVSIATPAQAPQSPLAPASLRSTLYFPFPFHCLALPPPFASAFASNPIPLPIIP